MSDILKQIALTQAISTLAPGALWSLSGDDLKGLVWLDQNIPRPADDAINAQIALPVIPQEVTPLQARKALRQVGLIDQVNAAVNAATPDIQDAWNYASVVKRTDPMVAALATTLNLTPTALDHLFTLAASL